MNDSLSSQPKVLRQKNNRRALAEPKWYIFLACLAAGIVLVISGYSTLRVQESARSEVRSLLSDTLNATLARMRDWENVRRRELEVWASDPDVISLIGTLVSYGNKAPKLLHNDARNVLLPPLRSWEGETYSVVGLDGVVLTSSAEEDIGTQSPVFEIPGFVHHLLKGEPRISKPMHRPQTIGSGDYASEPHFFAHGQSGHLSQYVGAPVQAENGGPIAILVFELDPIKDFSSILASGRGRETMETFAVDYDGTMLSESRFNEGLFRAGIILDGDHSMLNVHLRDPGVDLRSPARSRSLPHDPPLTVMANSLVGGQSGINLEGYRSYMGHRVVGAWVWVEDFGFGLATEMHFKEAFATYLTVSWQMMGASILAAILLVGLAVLFNMWRRRLSDSTRRLQTILDSVMDGIIVINERGTIETYNASAAKIFGYDIDEIIGENVSVLMPEPDRSRHDGYLRRYIQSSQNNVLGVGREVVGKRKDDSVFPIDLAVTEMEVHDRRLFLGITRDITDRKSAQEQLRRSEESLRTAQRIAQLGGWVWDLNDDAITWSDEIFHILGRPLNSFSPNVDAFIEAVHPDDRAMVRLAINTTLTKKTPYGVEHRVVLLDGTVRTVYGQGELTFNDEGKAVRLNGIIHDITDRKAAERLKSEFVSTVSHELRTPLTSIYGSLGLLVSGAVGEINQQGTELLKVAHKNTDRLVRLIDDILDVEKLEAGEMGFNIQPQQVDELLSQALEANKSYADTYGIALRCDETVPGAYIDVDADRLAQVMANLISNAVKYSPQDKDVVLSAEERDNHIRISVIDYGSGIPKEFQPRIFKQFTQADASDTRQKGGTGLGLSISKAIVEKMHGEIGFLTEAGSGTTFYFEFDRLE